MKDERFQVQVSNGQRWVCIRPQKSYSVLGVSLREIGFKKLVNLLQPNAVTTLVRRDEKGRIWCTGIPDQHEVVEWGLANVEGLMEMYEKRTHSFNDVRNECARLAVVDKELRDSGTAKPAVLAETLEINERLFAALFHSILLTGLLVDEVGTKFFNCVVEAIGNREGLEHVTQLFRTPYAEEATRTRKAFLKHEQGAGGAEGVEVTNARTNTAPTSGLEGKVASAILCLPLAHRSEVWHQYIDLRLIAPIIVQFNDEQAYLWRAYTRLVGRVLQAGANVARDLDCVFENLSIAEAIRVLRN